MDKIMYVTVKLNVTDTATMDDILEADYSFEHKDIISTEWFELEES
jgi:hypothetical protein